MVTDTNVWTNIVLTKARHANRLQQYMVMNAGVLWFKMGKKKRKNKLTKAEFIAMFILMLLITGLSYLRFFVLNKLTNLDSGVLDIVQAFIIFFGLVLFGLIAKEIFSQKVSSKITR